MKKVEIEITPEIEEWAKEYSPNGLYCGSYKSALGLNEIHAAIQKAKEKPVIDIEHYYSRLKLMTMIEKIHWFEDKIKEIIDWINNHDRN